TELSSASAHRSISRMASSCTSSLEGSKSNRFPSRKRKVLRIFRYASAFRSRISGETFMSSRDSTCATHSRRMSAATRTDTLLDAGLEQDGHELNLRLQPLSRAAAGAGDLRGDKTLQALGRAAVGSVPPRDGPPEPGVRALRAEQRRDVREEPRISQEGGLVF